MAEVQKLNLVGGRPKNTGRKVTRLDCLALGLTEKCRQTEPIPILGINWMQHILNSDDDDDNDNDDDEDDDDDGDAAAAAAAAAADDDDDDDGGGGGGDSKYTFCLSLAV